MNRSILEDLLNRNTRADSFDCVASVKYDSRSKEFTIRSTENIWHDDISRSANAFVQVIVTMDFSSAVFGRINDTHIITEFKFMCFSRDECDFGLILEYFDELSRMNYDKLVIFLHPLLQIQGERRGKHFIVVF